MEIAEIAQVVLALAVAGSGTATLTRNRKVMAILEGVGFPLSRAWVLGVIKLAGAAGLLIGVVAPVVGAAAATGLVAYFVGAVWVHLRARRFDLIAPGMFLGLSVVTLALVFGSA